MSANISDDFLTGLREVLNVIDLINQSDEEEDTLVLQDNIFITPLFILPLLVYVNGCHKRVRFQYTHRYLDTIGFRNGGIRPEELGSCAFHSLLNQCLQKTYIPIIGFPTNLRYTNERNNILSAVGNLLSRQAQLELNIKTGIKYLIEESVDNVIEHSESERGYIFSQSYPTKRYMDICIADNGITLLGSYRKMERNQFRDHLAAMKAAHSGISTKNLADAENRGYGIRTSKEMLVSGLSGSFVMLSGNALYLKSRTVDECFALPDVATWQGTIVAMRVPYVNRNFNYIRFVE